MIKEIPRKCASGYLALVVIPALNILDAWLFYKAVTAEYVLGIFLTVLAFIVIVISILVGRLDVRVFTKEVRGFVGVEELSPEEKAAVTRAAGGNLPRS